MAAATSTIPKKPCSKCDKGGGIFTCDGCQLSFCRKHSDEHRQELGIQMDSVGQEHDLLQRDINRELDIHPLFSQIDAWERECIDKIQQVAKQARTDLNQAIDQKKGQLKTALDRLTNDLQNSRESEDYTELELNKWIAQLNELQRDLEQSINTRLIDEEDPRSIIRLITVQNFKQLSSPRQSIRTSGQNMTPQSAMLVNGERFGKTDKEIEILDNGLVATHLRIECRRPAIAFGLNQYSENKHQICFRIEKKINNGFYMGIVTLAQTNPTSIFASTSTTSGWWPSYTAIENGEFRSDYSTVGVLTGDEITMTLNCDEKTIYFNHQRTNETLQLLVNIQKCPFPWKLVVGSTEIGNWIRIVH